MIEQVVVLTEDEANELLEFWTMVYNALELLDKAINKEAITNKANITRIREDVNRAMITANREYKIIMKLFTRGEPLQ